MKVIFIKDLKGKGKKNEVKEFSDGYATNFLIKNNYAVKYTESSSKRLDKDLKEIKRLDDENSDNANKLKKELENKKFKFISKAGKDGRLFGTISSKQISDKLNEQGYKIDKKNIKINLPINSLGCHQVEIVLYKKIIATINIEVTEK